MLWISSDCGYPGGHPSQLREATLTVAFGSEAACHRRPAPATSSCSTGVPQVSSWPLLAVSRRLQSRPKSRRRPLRVPAGNEAPPGLRLPDRRAWIPHRTQRKRSRRWNIYCWRDRSSRQNAQHTQRSSLGVEAVACYRCRPIGVHLREMGHTIKINSTGSNLCRY